jgi:hypothetical protein
MAACAAFFKESRLRFVDPIKPYRKSGGMGHPAAFFKERRLRFVDPTKPYGKSGGMRHPANYHGF